VRTNPALDLTDAGERPIPARLQFRRDQPVLGIGRVILPKCPFGGVARRLEITRQRVADLVAAAGRLRLGLDGRCDRTRLDDLQKRFLNGVIDAQSAEGDAARFGIVHPAATAAVARNLVLRP
jgi:hypothetical protein